MLIHPQLAGGFEAHAIHIEHNSGYDQQVDLRMVTDNSSLQGYLAHKKQPPTRTLRQDYA